MVRNCLIEIEWNVNIDFDVNQMLPGLTQKGKRERYKLQMETSMQRLTITLSNSLQLKLKTILFTE